MSVTCLIKTGETSLDFLLFLSIRHTVCWMLYFYTPVRDAQPRDFSLRMWKVDLKIYISRYGGKGYGEVRWKEAFWE